MAWNTGENDEQRVQPEVQGAVQGEVQTLVQGVVQGGGAGGAPDAAPAPDEELSVEEIERVALFRKYRDRMHDVPDDRIERLVLAMREGKSNLQAARELVEEGFCPALSPISVRHYVAKLREALGIPGWEPTEQPAPGDEKDEPIEGQPSLKQLKWLTRIQQARVRKALGMERLMGSLILPLASHEIQIMQDLIDKGLEIELKTGDLKQEPVKVEVTQTDDKFEGLTQAEAYRVYLAVRKTLKMAPEILAETDNTEGE